MKRSILRSVVCSLMFVMLVTSSKCSDNSNSDDNNSAGEVENTAAEATSEESTTPDDDPLPQEFLDIGAKELPVTDESDTSPILEKLNEVDREELSALIETSDKSVPYTGENKELDDQLGKDVGEWLVPENNEPATEAQ